METDDLINYINGGSKENNKNKGNTRTKQKRVKKKKNNGNIICICFLKFLRWSKFREC